MAVCNRRMGEYVGAMRRDFALVGEHVEFIMRIAQNCSLFPLSLFFHSLVYYADGRYVILVAKLFLLTRGVHL